MNDTQLNTVSETVHMALLSELVIDTLDDIVRQGPENLKKVANSDPEIILTTLEQLSAVIGGLTEKILENALEATGVDIVELIMNTAK